MHYHKSKFLRFANAAFEFLLLILTFIFAGWLRSYTPMGSQFFMWDIWTFLPTIKMHDFIGVTLLAFILPIIVIEIHKWVGRRFFGKRPDPAPQPPKRAKASQI